MKNDSITRVFWGIIFVGLIAFTIATSVCTAEERSRKGKQEIYVLGQSMGEATTGETIAGLELKMGFAGSFAFGAGYGTNFTDNLNLNTDVFFSSKDAIAIIGSRRITVLNSNFTGFDVNLDYNILKDRFTPMITGGIGFVRIRDDSGTYGESDFSYNVGGGFRWDITNNFLIKTIYKTTWMKMEDTNESLSFGGISFSIGYIF